MEKAIQIVIFVSLIIILFTALYLWVVYMDNKKRSTGPAPAPAMAPTSSPSPARFIRRMWSFAPSTAPAPVALATPVTAPAPTTVPLPATTPAPAPAL